MDFNIDQKQALKIVKDQNVLVSAGAGSGKTRVLTTKIVTLLKNGYSLDDLLVVTFSNKAAFEMKDRVKDMLSKEKDPYLNSLVTKLETSDITTFDAYYLKIVKTYGYLLGIRSDVSIVNESVFEVKTNEFIDIVFDKYYKKPTKEFKDLIYYYALRKDDHLKELVSLIIKEASKDINRNKYYDTYKEVFFDKKQIKKYIDDLYLSLKDSILEARKIYLNIDLDEYVDLLEKTFYEPLLKNDYDSLATSIIAFDQFPDRRKKIYKPNEEDELDYDFSKQILKGVLSIVKEVGTSKDIYDVEERLQPYNYVLVKIAKEVDDLLWEYKNKYGAYTFKDIATLAYDLVNIKEVNDKLRSKIKFIMIDEYQDTNPMQEDFINLIANNNLFMVGDMKQSIYRFRDADPSIFQEKYLRYEKGEGGQLIIFKYNYRSREDILHSVNDIFGEIMSEEVGGLDYKFGHELRFGNIEAYNNLGPNNYNNAFTLYSYLDNGKDNAANQEINAVLDDIIDKINNKYQVYDFAKKKCRDCEFKDFAILVEKRTHYETYKQEFNKRQIPLKSDDASDSKLFKSTIVIRSILKLIIAIKNNSIDRIINHSYISLARSFLYEISDAQIHNIILKNKVRETDIYKKAESIIPYIDYLSNEAILRLIIKEFDIVSKLSKIGDVMSNNQNIQQMINFASDMDKLEYSFYEMEKFFEKLDTYEISLDIENDEDVDNAVNILTIHKSKGLEYPICYFINLGSPKKANSYPLNSLVSRKYGVHLRDIFNDRRSIFDYFAKAIDKKESTSEQMRLFYVALTRAKEKPIAFVSDKQLEKYQGKYDPRNANKMLDFIMASNYQQYLLPFIKTNATLTNFKQNKSIKAKFDIRSVNIKSEIIYPKKASKDLSLGVDKGALRYGNKMHEYLEIVDFKNNDTKFIKNKKERENVDRILNLPLFKNANNALIYHEYEFDDEINNTVGIIDMMLIYNDHIDIVDFKLKNLDDEQYISQLEIYENFVKDNLNNDLPINKYLLSILTGEIKKI